MQTRSIRPTLLACLLTTAVTSQSEPSAEARRGSSFGVRSAGQDEIDYSLRGQFEQHHGEFLERYENFNPDIELRLRGAPNQRVGEEPGSFDLWGYDFDLEREAVVSHDAYLILGLYHHSRRYVTSGDFGAASNGGQQLGDETLGAVGARLGFGWFLGDNLLLKVKCEPGIFSDFDGTVRQKDYDVPSSAVVHLRTTEDFFLTAGVRYNQVFAEAPWLPVLGFGWQVTEQLRIDLEAPEKLEISWWPNAQTAFALGTMVRGAEYHVRAPGSGGTERADLRVQEVVTYLGFTHRFDDTFAVITRTGVVTGGKYELTDGSAGFDAIEGELQTGFYADITFGIDW